jgi:hypothetical protein
MTLPPTKTNQVEFVFLRLPPLPSSLMIEICIEPFALATA